MRSAGETSHLIGHIYDAAADASLWEATLRHIVAATGARAGHLLMTEPKRSRRNVVSANFDANETEKYNTYYWRFDPVAPLMEETAVGTLVTCRDVVSARERENEFYRDWALPNEVGDGVFINIERRGNSVCSLVVARPWLSKPLATSRTVRTLELLVPHFQRALEVRNALADARQNHATARELIETPHACTLIGADGRVIYANAAARRMTFEREGLVLTDRGLEARAARDQAALQQLMRMARPRGPGESRSGGRMNITRGARRPPVNVQTLPLSYHWLGEVYPGCTLVLIIDGERLALFCRQALQTLYGLTPAETAVAVRIPGSRNLQQLADELGLSLSTVRTQLQRTFDKTGTHRQAELVQLLSALEMIDLGTKSNPPGD
jgi:DNA-binding CsgD family transcriptional regulator/PAS domain-containing protein